MVVHWITSTRFWSCSFRSSANSLGRLLLLTFTAKQIVLRITWPTLVTPLRLVFISLICRIGACPTGFVMTLLVFHSPKVLVF
ncbi:hypothetical protein LINGRAHAP2_LOCUS4641 [Linum grandiflorum]